MTDGSDFSTALCPVVDVSPPDGTPVDTTDMDWALELYGPRPIDPAKTRRRMLRYFTGMPYKNALCKYLKIRRSRSSTARLRTGVSDVDVVYDAYVTMGDKVDYLPPYVTTRDAEPSSPRAKIVERLRDRVLPKVARQEVLSSPRAKSAASSGDSQQPNVTRQEVSSSPRAQSATSRGDSQQPKVTRQEVPSSPRAQSANSSKPPAASQ